MESSSSIVIKVMSCKDLKAFNFFQKLCVYSTVSIASDDPKKKLEKKQQQRTPTDREGDGNPEWNHEMRFELDEDHCDHLFIHFEMRVEVMVFGDKSIGEVQVPFKDLIDQSSKDGVVRFVCYEVRTSDGKPNGVLNFSYKVDPKYGTAITSSSPVSSNIDGWYPVASSHPTDEIYYPTVQVETSQLEYPSFESQETYSAPQWISPQHTSQSHEAHHYPPPHQFYHLPPFLHYPPPPPYHHHPPPYHHHPPPPPPYHHHPPPPPLPAMIYPWPSDSCSGHGSDGAERLSQQISKTSSNSNE